MENEDFPRLRLRIRANQTVSSLAVYESAYTYCPAKALMISSRQNIRFSPDFVDVLSSKLNEKHHVYFSAFKN